VHNVDAQSENLSAGRDDDPTPAGTRYISEGHTEGDSSEVRNQISAFYNPRHQGQINAITRHSGLILDLKVLQPASLSEIAEEVGQSTSTVRNHLKRLAQLDLVVRIAFEHHTLYCLNGDYNVHFERILGELYE